MSTPRAVLIILLIAIGLAVNAELTCRESSEFKQEVTCRAGLRTSVLTRNLISDNEKTAKIILAECRITGIELNAFNNLPALRHLDLSKNEITTITTGIFNGANNVTHLILSYNQIAEIPETFFKDLRFIELLDLKGNKLQSLGQGLFEPLSRIGHLDLSSNLFKGQFLSNRLFLNNPYIGFLDFSGIEMLGTPDDLLQSFRIIDFINMAGCALTEVPKFATASNLKSMKRLSMLSNQITQLSDPNTFVNLENLEMLNLAHNFIDIIHGDIFKSQNRLKTVILKDNRIRKLPETLFTNKYHIVEIDLSRNLIDFICTDTFKGTSVNDLDLSGNRFSFLPPEFGASLTNAGATLSKFIFNNNPWQCACLREILGEMKSLHVEYNSDEYSGTKPVCVMITSSFTCDREPTHGKLFIKEYLNLINKS